MRDPAVAVEQRGEPIEIGARPASTTGAARQQARDFRRRRVGGRLQRDIAGHHHDRDAALADRLADRDLERARHLVGAGDQLAIVAAFAGTGPRGWVSWK